MIRPGAIQSVSEVALWVTDVEAAMAFYVDALGFKLQSHDAGRNAFLASGDFLLVLFNRESPGTVLSEAYLEERGSPQGEVYHVAFRVDAEELDAYGEGLRSEDYPVRGPVEFPTGRRSYFVEDLDQHLIELTDR